MWSCDFADNVKVGNTQYAFFFLLSTMMARWKHVEDGG